MPYGMPVSNSDSVKLTFAEFESIRLADYNNLPQDQAAKTMNVSRPTFTRIHNRALKQIAQSFVEGRPIEINGGHYEFDKEWYRCKKCGKLIEGIENHFQCDGCTFFGDNELIKLN